MILSSSANNTEQLACKQNPSTFSKISFDSSRRTSCNRSPGPNHTLGSRISGLCANATPSHPAVAVSSPSHSNPPPPPQAQSLHVLRVFPCRTPTRQCLPRMRATASTGGSARLMPRQPRKPSVTNIFRQLHCNSSARERESSDITAATQGGSNFGLPGAYSAGAARLAILKEWNTRRH
jgi:hypothetical protein